MTALEILDKLRAVGVEPMTDEQVERIGRVLLEQGAGEGRLVGNRPARLTADLIEARTKLDAVREWARAMIDCAPDTVPYEHVGRDVLAILDGRGGKP